MERNIKSKHETKMKREYPKSVDIKFYKKKAVKKTSGIYSWDLTARHKNPNDRTIGMGREDRRLVSQGRFLNG